MAVKVYYDVDANLDLLKGKTVAIIGYGSQGHAHALNLHESGVNVVVGLRPGKSWDAAIHDGLTVKTVAEAVKEADITMILVNDEFQSALYREQIKDNLKPGSAIAFGHGFNIRFGQITPPAFVDVAMVAPKGPGHTLRLRFQEGLGLPALVAVHQPGPDADLTRSRMLAWATAIGSARAAIVETTFAAEAEATPNKW